VKTISVKEAAQALGLTTRSVQYKLQNGELKGTRQKNQYGVMEWRVWPTKEIAEGLPKAGSEAASSGGTINFSPVSGEAVDAETVDFQETEDAGGGPADWQKMEMERLEIMAEKLMKPLAERLEYQAKVIGDQQRMIEDQRRQILLLPDLQKQAEESRKTSETAHLENEALKKQILAMEEENAAREHELGKVKELESQVSSLNSEIQKMQTPWWKKWFTGPAEHA
jgi:hypothetical protein